MTSKILSPVIRFSTNNQGIRNTLHYGLLVSGATLLGLCNNYNSSNNLSSVKCESRREEAVVDEESSRFDSTLSYHRLRRKDYEKIWQPNEEEILSFKNGTWSSSGQVMVWPSEVPQRSDIPALQFDLKMCKRSPNYRDVTSYCNTVQFRVASALLLSSEEEEYDEGLMLMKDLAERGHPDGMCGYGLCLMLGRGGLESNPIQAVGWFRRCVEMHNHPQAMYELGVALYIGEGVVENEEQATKYFRKAAKLGNVAAAYMYGECLLDGVGAIRDRTKALSWLVRAAQSGHKTAQSRVLAVLDYLDASDQQAQQHQSKKLNIRTTKSSNIVSDAGPADELEDSEMDLQEQILLEKLQWQREHQVQVERRYTIGGSSPAVLARRRTIVQESRKAE